MCVLINLNSDAFSSSSLFIVFCMCKTLHILIKHMNLTKEWVEMAVDITNIEKETLKERRNEESFINTYRSIKAYSQIANEILGNDEIAWFNIGRGPLNWLWCLKMNFHVGAWNEVKNYRWFFVMITAKIRNKMAKRERKRKKRMKMKRKK